MRVRPSLMVVAANESSSQWDGSSRWLNTIQFSDPVPIPLEEILGSKSLVPSQSIDLPLCLHAVTSGDQHLQVLVVYREVIDNRRTHHTSVSNL